MSAFRHPHNTKVRSLEEELAEMGLNPDKVLSEIDRNTAMLEGGPVPFDLAGLHEGDNVPRSLSQYGSTLLAKGLADLGESFDDESLDEAGNGSCTGAYDKGGDDKKGRGRGMGVGKGKGPVGRRGSDDDFDDDEGMDESAPPSDMAFFTWSEIEDIIAETLDEGYAEKLRKEIIGMKKRGKIPGQKSGGGGFTALVKELKKRGAKDPEALAAWIGRKKYGTKKMAKMAAAGRKESVDDGEDVIVERQWIQQAIKDPGRVREYLGVPEGEKIPVAKLNTAIEKLKVVEDKSDEQKSLLSALVLAKRLKSGDIGESLDESVKDIFIEEDTISDALYLINEGWELTEVFQIVKKARGAAARLAKRMRHRKYLMQRGSKKLAAKIFRRRFKRKIKRVQKRKEAKFGKKGLSRLHQMGRRVVMRQPSAAKKEWSEAISSITEELERDTAPVDANFIEETEEPTYVVVEVLINAATTAMYLGEIFDAIGDDAGKILFRLSEKSVDLADLIENNGGEPTEEQEEHVKTVLGAIIRALKEHEDIGSPSLGEAIGMTMVSEGIGTWEELVEYNVPSPMELQQKIAGKKMGSAVTIDPTVAGKYLKAINIAMQKMDQQAAIKAAEVVTKKHKVMDSKGLLVPRVENMTDVLRVVFYLSQIAGLKAPAWMYKGKQKPWFVTTGDEDEPGKAKTDDAKLVTALKALGAPSGVLAALAAV